MRAARSPSLKQSNRPFEMSGALWEGEFGSRHSLMMHWLLNGVGVWEENLELNSLTFLLFDCSLLHLIIEALSRQALAFVSVA